MPRFCWFGCRRTSVASARALPAVAPCECPARAQDGLARKSGGGSDSQTPKVDFTLGRVLCESESPLHTLTAAYAQKDDKWKREGGGAAHDDFDTIRRFRQNVAEFDHIGARFHRIGWCSQMLAYFAVFDLFVLVAPRQARSHRRTTSADQPRSNRIPDVICEISSMRRMFQSAACCVVCGNMRIR